MWFGRHWGAGVCDSCQRVEAPRGEACRHCDEPIEPGDDGVMMWHGLGEGSGYRPLHQPCFERGGNGGVYHQLGVCICFEGGTQPDTDPAWMSKRQAAETAQAIRMFLDAHGIERPPRRLRRG